MSNLNGDAPVVSGGAEADAPLIVPKNLFRSVKEMVGRTPFDPRKCCPFPHMTQPVLPGEEFEALEYVKPTDFT